MRIVRIFIEIKYVLPKKILGNSDFGNLKLIVIFNKEISINVIILYLYKLYTYIC